jgi:hypothetical protein
VFAGAQMSSTWQRTMDFRPCGFESYFFLRDRQVRCLQKAAFMNLRALTVGTVPLLATGVSSAQNGSMMNGGMWGGGGWMGGYGGVWGPILLVIVVVGLVVWVVQRKGK